MLEPDPNFPSRQARRHAAELSCRCDACGASANDADLVLSDRPSNARWLCIDGAACHSRRMTTERREATLDDAQITAIVDAWSDEWLWADTRELWRTWM